jgi:hypothetical protein
MRKNGSVKRAIKIAFATGAVGLLFTWVVAGLPPIPEAMAAYANSCRNSQTIEQIKNEHAQLKEAVLELRLASQDIQKLDVKIEKLDDKIDRLTRLMIRRDER